VYAIPPVFILTSKLPKTEITCYPLIPIIGVIAGGFIRLTVQHHNL
jgi:uncharacterized membrane protein